MSPVLRVKTRRRTPVNRRSRDAHGAVEDEEERGVEASEQGRREAEADEAERELAEEGVPALPDDQAVEAGPRTVEYVASNHERER